MSFPPSLSSSSPASSPTPAPNAETSDQLPNVHNVLIIGAGPSGLAVAARLRENTPSALYTDEEHRRFHWLARHSGRSSVKDRKTGKVKTPEHASSHDSRDAHPAVAGRPEDDGLVVLDAEGGEWMARWKRVFGVLGIERLRSPMFFHPDPGDRDALRGFAHEKGREGELSELVGCVGREVSKHKKKKMMRGGGKCGAKTPSTVNERERSDYYTPSSDLFGDFCADVVGRYGLDSPTFVRKTRVLDIDYGPVSQLEQTEDLFTVRADTGVFFARAVVLAMGAGEFPHVPAPFGGWEGCGGLTVPLAAKGGEGLIARGSVLGRKIREGRRTEVVVVGGGLTSAQVADAAIRGGAGRVWMIMRGPMRVKPFDVDLSWMGKFRNQEMAAFWMADSDDERAEMLASARGGGSITPHFAKILSHHVTSGRLTLCPHTSITSASYNPSTSLWNLVPTPSVPSLPDDTIDHVFLATGSSTPFSSLPCLQTLSSKFPLEEVAGLPKLTDDLMWSEDVPAFITGKFAGLRVGPGAANLEGARAGAERVVLGLLERGMVGAGKGGGEGGERRDSGIEVKREGEGKGKGQGDRGDLRAGQEARERYVSGYGNRFEMFGRREEA